MNQHRYFGGIGAEMGVKMPDRRRAQQRFDVTGLGEVDQVYRQWTFCPPAKTPHHGQGSNETLRTGKERAKDGDK